MNLSSPFNKNWSYIENILPKYLISPKNRITVIANFLQYTNDNKISTSFSEPNEIVNDIEIKRINFLFTNNSIFDWFNSRIRLYEDFNPLLENINPDLVFLIGLNFTNLFSTVKFLKTSGKVVFAFHGATSYHSGKGILSKYLVHRFYYKILISFSQKYLDKIYFGSEAALDFYKLNYLIPTKYDISHLGVDSIEINTVLENKTKEKLRLKYSFSSDDFIIIYGGKIDKKKNSISLIKAFMTFQNYNYRLIIFGEINDDVKDEFNSLVKDDSRIIIFGWANPISIYELFFISDLGIFSGTKSSLWEVAVAVGLPLIARKWEGYGYLDFGGNIYWLEKYDYISISESIINIVKGDKLKKMSIIASENGMKNLSYSNFANEILLDYHDKILISIYDL